MGGRGGKGGAAVEPRSVGAVWKRRGGKGRGRRDEASAEPEGVERWALGSGEEVARR
jgi:hypothetical protein